MDEFYSVFSRRKLKVNARKSKVMVFEVEVVDINMLFKCGVVEWVKILMLRKFGHMEIKKSTEFVKKVYVSKTEDITRKGRPIVRLKDRVKEYVHERVDDRWEGIELAKECVDRKRWRLFCHNHPFGGHS